MPVRSDDTLWPFDDFEGINADDLFTSSFPSDDIWKKFDFSDSLNEFATPLDNDLELDAVLEWSLDATASEIRHHDCMWAGHCGSKEHKPENIKIARPLLQVTCPPVQPRRPVIAQHAVQTSSRSLLLNSRNNVTVTMTQNKTIVQPVGIRPDSPPSSDDDDHPRFKHEVTLFETVGGAGNPNSIENKTLQFLNDAISECDFDEDSDLCDYLEDSDVFSGKNGDCDVEPEVREDAPRDFSSVSDHSYHKGKGAQLRTDHLGVQTPSDSEEEIDVVSVGEKQLTTNRNCTVLPTNPSMRDRQKLQRTVASAISSKREFVAPTTGGIKTRLPLRLPNTSSNCSNGAGVGAKKRGAGPGAAIGPDGRRGVKRGRHHRYGKGGGSSPAKRRGFHSSDSETECSEKRSLHNNMERQRRVDLRNAFDELRILVPEVCCKDRAAKVVILREAAAYCRRLANESLAQQKQVAELRRQQERLRARVSQLRRSLAAKR